MEFQRRKYKQFALMQLKGRWKAAILATLIVLVVQFVFSIPGSRDPLTMDEIQYISGYTPMQLLSYLNETGRVTPGKSFFSLISDLISLVLAIATASLFLTYSRSPEPVGLKTFFEGFNKWGRGILAGLWQGLWLFLWMAGAFVIGVVIITVLAFIITDTELYMAIAMLVIMLLMMVIAIIKAIEYSHHMLLVAEFPELGIMKALRISKLITKGHRMDIFITVLTYIGLLILGMLPMFIGLLWVLPYIHLTIVK